MPFNKYVPGNNAQSQLLGSISAAAVTFIVEAGEGDRFPTTFPFLVEIKQNDTVAPYAVLKREILKVTNRVGDTFTATRSAGTCLPDATSNTPGTTAFSFSSGDTVTLTVTAETIKDIQDEIDTKLSKSGGIVTGLIQGAKSTNIASATTTNLATLTGNFAHVTGTTTITGFGTLTAGTQICLVFDGILTLTYNATSMILPTAANITTAVGDTAIFESEGSGNWKCISYTRADGTSLASLTTLATKRSLTAGVTLSAGEHVRMGVASIAEIVNFIDDDGIPAYAIGYDTTNQFVGQGITTVAGPTGKQLKSIQIIIGKIGTPTGNLTCKVYSNTGTTLIGTSTNTIAESTLSTTIGTKCTFNFTGVNLSNSTAYYFRIECDRANSNTNYSRLHSGSNFGSEYTGGSAYAINSGNTWTINTAKDLIFQINTWYNETLDRVYKTSAYFPELCDSIGIVSTGGSAENTVILDTNGSNQNQTGLTAGSRYYYSDTAGTISLTPGTNRVIAGIAESTTSLNIKPQIDQTLEINYRIFIDMTTASITKKYFHGLGRTPKFMISSGVAQKSSNGQWSPGYQYSSWYDGANPGISTTSGLALINAAGSSQTGIISAVDSDSFTVTWTRNGTPTGSGYINIYIQ